MRQSLLLLVLTSLCFQSVCHGHVYHFINESKNWIEARQYCRDYYTDLVTVNNATDVSCVCPYGTDCRDAWVRLDGPNNNQCQSDGEWRWIGENIYNESEANWKIDEPKQMEGNCVYVKKKSESKLSWYNQSCESTGRVICYKESPGKSEDHYKAHPKLMTWCEALHHCRRKKKNLVSSYDQLNDKKLIDLIHENGDYEQWWIGLFRTPLSCSDEVLCESQQNNFCATLGQDNKWKRDNCTQEHPFICYDDRMVLVKQNKTWEEALLFCRKHYGDLAIMTNDDQQEMVEKKSMMADTDFVWVGLHFVGFFKEWVWVNGHWVSSSDQNWEKKNERNNCSVSGAVKKDDGQTWVKRWSGERNNFICTIHC